MLDGIGLGSAIANVIYVIILVFGILGIYFFIKMKLKIGLFFWISCILNLSFYLLLMGNYSFYPKLVYSFVNNYWPYINLALFILLIISIIKNKYVKKQK
jgi:hypothetical protein